MANRKLWRLAETPLHFVILGRSKERSDAAQTLGSMPLPKPKNAADQNRTPTTPVPRKSSNHSSIGAASASAGL
ncbi:MAG: hypothetical protein EOS07_01450 [Mesorhizobium sp.]|nr:MAG: hypothetical protein EOQ56_01275 [Mesorhizobium sp.]RWO13368.1 MAG: hypothetical protein EOS07_01450 [Mesorhizobium sp.]RWO16012.1 MAG: hypothetical protein EOS08_28560 [Mesorhizobium sp.]RWP09020.1 MAG: hypothetical protein EOQ99_01670 [Mesorhizobium sp.]RWP33768.1 MAG: hypothetical protein EOR02_03065 [Mesorhizobium sp.]